MAPHSPFEGLNENSRIPERGILPLKNVGWGQGEELGFGLSLG